MSDSPIDWDAIDEHAKAHPIDREAERDMFAEIGNLTIQAGAIDNGYAVMFGRLISHTQRSFDISVPSIVIFTAKSLGQREELVRKVFRWRLEETFQQKRHTNIFRAASFTEKLMNVTFANVRKNRWYRNLAAHGAVHWDGERVRLQPTFLDMEAATALSARGEDYKNGITIEQLREGLALAIADKKCMASLSGHVLWSLLEWQEDPSEFLLRANGLARDLGLPSIHLQDPREGRPFRQSRKNKDRPKGS